MKYRSLKKLTRLITGPQGVICRQMLADNRKLFRQGPGSSHNHQAWEKGYWHHITEVMNICVRQYKKVLLPTGRLELLPPHEQFTLSDALLVLFIHDLEKPWRYTIQDGQVQIREDLRDKAARTAFVQQKLAEYGLVLTPVQANALKYVEGIRDCDYTPNDRVMWPLAALVHTCDLLSGRFFYGFPLMSGDPWAPGRTAFLSR